MAGKKPNKKGKSNPSSDADDAKPRHNIGPTNSESLLRKLLAENGKRASKSQRAAQDIVELAWQAQNPEQRIEFARQAISIWPDCADAYLLLAHQAETHEESRTFLEAGVDAGERAIGPDRFASSTGNFWLDTITRPYMRARLRLAQCLWESGRRDDAIGHYADLLRLNPHDNQGVRYLLLSALVDTDCDAEALVLLSEYDGEESAEWSYTSALLSFRHEGDTLESRKLLEMAARVNRHVPAYLVGAKPLPVEAPQYIILGEESEAAGYVGQFLRNWRGNEGAIPWVRKVLKVSLPRPPKPRKPNWSLFHNTFLNLPQAADEVWQIDVCRLPFSTGERRKSQRPWALIVWNSSSESILSFEVGNLQPPAREAWEILLETLLRPRTGDPHRPKAIELRRKTFWKAWHSKLEEIEIECRLVDELEGFDQVLESFIPAAANVRRLLDGGDDGPELNTDELNEIPQEFGEVWQVDARRLPGWIEQDGELHRPWATLVAGRDEHLVFYQSLAGDEPELSQIAKGVIEAIVQPLAGEPHRPSTIEVVREDLRELLAGDMEKLGIACVHNDQLVQIDDVFREVGRFLSGGKSPPALVEVPGVRLEQVGSFYDAAAQFYRYSPWRKVPGDMVIKVVCPKYQSDTWYGIVMGQSGMVLGLALYQDLEMLRELFAGENEDEVAHKSSGLSIMYGEAFEIPTADLDASERYRWPVASVEAYPNPIYVNPGRSTRPPLSWELELLEASLRGILRFLESRKTNADFLVPTASGDMQIAISRLAT